MLSIHIAYISYILYITICVNCDVDNSEGGDICDTNDCCYVHVSTLIVMRKLCGASVAL